MKNENENLVIVGLDLKAPVLAPRSPPLQLHLWVAVTRRINTVTKFTYSHNIIISHFSHSGRRRLVQ